MKALIASVRLRSSRPVKMSRRSAGSPAARLAARRRILRSPPEQGKAPVSRAVAAAAQSIAACAAPVAAMVMLVGGDVPGEVAAAQECVVADEQFDGGLVGVDAAGAGTQGFRERILRCQVTGHGVSSLPGGGGVAGAAMRVKAGMPRSVTAGWRAVRASSAWSFSLTVARET
jgi:hypothetical protein